MFCFCMGKANQQLPILLLTIVDLFFLCTLTQCNQISCHMSGTNMYRANKEITPFFLGGGGCIHTTFSCILPKTNIIILCCLEIM